eukprot:TRINITY_DN14920_c0_g1_i3.p1 TRINITY_DN14920_c0_g1~~TRINITY_DN14920_c0_g1_i3.p1  ORF type:complete len:173 (-),score=8.29 TRINITY_DN14920_c0_g1_i3:32-529(-)
MTQLGFAYKRAGLTQQQQPQRKQTMQQHSSNKTQQPGSFLKRPLFYVAVVCQVLLILLYIKIYQFWESQSVQLLEQSQDLDIGGISLSSYNRHDHSFIEKFGRQILQQENDVQIQDKCPVKKTILNDKDRRKALAEFWAVKNFVLQYQSIEIEKKNKYRKRKNES